ncbi:short subunit dehydrogenase [Motilibacter peucedani]|uniref:Short subunit dehydrogenase n=1 Tax=Motilibacter peucedani TaxID=598650 RepID=A0A420XV42_9ACTN|nr:SDR family NAD(P)-dependent oxidoreductase [Motilibacter peucedani]RKS80723.1 short subunit dehydrogenase [Motilibacter peucedani]
MTTTLITGASKGLGRETARRLVEAGHDVYVAARDSERGRTAARELGCRFVELDVLDDGSVAAAVEEVGRESGGLDVLVNNAGITGGTVAAATTTADHVQRVHSTNVLGVVRVTHAFLPLLLRSSSPAVVNVSSGLGSFAVMTDAASPWSAWKGLSYASSKAALNMLTVQYAKNFPQVVVAMATAGADGPTGGFFDASGRAPGDGRTRRGARSGGTVFRRGRRLARPAEVCCGQR